MYIDAKSSEGEAVESPVVQSTTDDDWRSGDFFPLMKLPKEMIILILHMLPTADRFRARVCKALYDMEKNEKFAADSVFVGSRENYERKDSIIYLPADEANAANTRAALRRFNENITVKYVEFEDVDFDLFPIIKSIANEQLFYWSLWGLHGWLSPELDADSFNSWIMERKSVFIWEATIGFSGQDLYNLFNEMASGQSQMVQLKLDSHRYENTRDLLNLLGITYIREEEKFRSTMKNSCIFVRKETWGDHPDYMAMLTESPYASLFICSGRMRLTVRRWAATNGVPSPGRQYYNELAIERFDENGEKPDGMREAAYGVTMADLWRDEEKYEKIPSHRFQIVEQ